MMVMEIRLVLYVIYSHNTIVGSGQKKVRTRVALTFIIVWIM